MSKSRRKFSASFKSKVALEAIQERETIEALSKKHEVHPNQIMSWKKELREKSEKVFSLDDRDKSEKDKALKMIDELYRQIGQLKVENEWLKKKLP